MNGVVALTRRRKSCGHFCFYGHSTLMAVPALRSADRDGGRTVTLSYFQPGAFLDGTVNLVEVQLGL